MKKQGENTTEVQGTEVNQELKSENRERRVQVTLTMLQELAANKDLLDAFIKITTEEPELKTPAIYQIAKREVRQHKLEL